uniref:C2H2-type domain-containing protein n=1 Tax=Parastrongyloides trichosuri TaxID=131310 RepID=A0A0N4Z955_PARTI
MSSNYLNMKNDNKEYCAYCNEIVANLKSHEMEHFKDRDGMNPLFECNWCFRTYLDMNELKNHINEIHGEHRNNRLFECESCGQNFTTQNGRDQHLITHIPNIMAFCMEGVDKRIEHEAGYLASNECPLCRVRTSTRKSFRFHLLFSHLLRNPKSLLTLVANEEVVARIPERELKVIGYLAKRYNNKKSEKEDKKKKREALKKLLTTRKRSNSRTISSSSSGVGSSVASDDDNSSEEIKKRKIKDEITIISKSNNNNKETSINESQVDTKNIPSKSNQEVLSLSLVSKPSDLRDMLLGRCLKTKIESSETSVLVCICDKQFIHQSDFEIHVACVHFMNGEIVI